jgi:hypothetical protein
LNPSPTRSKAWIVALGATFVVLVGLWAGTGKLARSPGGKFGGTRTAGSSPAGDPAVSRDRGTAVPRPDERAGGPGGRPSAAEASEPAGEPSGPPEEAAPIEPVSRDAERLAEELGRVVRDLEFSPGLREPMQQTVRPSPEPWRPDPSRQGPSPVVESLAPRRGKVAGGDRVVLRGQNLRVVEVMFGQSPGRIVSATGTIVVVETPASGAGPVAVAVTNDDGTWAVAGVEFTFSD